MPLVNVWVVREQDGERAIYVREAREEAARLALKLLAGPLRDQVDCLLVELHDFERACENDFEFPRMAIHYYQTDGRVIACRTEPE